MPKPLVVQTEDLDPAAAQWLGERCELVRCPWQDSAALERLLPRAAGLAVRTYTRVNSDLLAKAPNLRVVGRAGVGLDNIDLSACRARGVEVVYTPDANSTAVVELVFAVLLDAVRPRLFLDRPLEAAAWSDLRKELTGRRQLEEMTLGIWGLGRVGSRVARVAGALGMRVLYHDLRPIPESQRHGAAPVDLMALLSQSDALTLHVDGRASNRHLLNARTLSSLKPDAIIVNASRGFVVDALALADHLRRHVGASAILDVHEPEPIAPDNPLLGVPNAHLMPHIGAATAKAHRNMSGVVEDLWRVLAGERPHYPAPTDGSA